MSRDNFEEVKAQLESLDCLLATDDIDSVSEHVQKLKKSTSKESAWSPYLLFTVKLSGSGDREYSREYLCGFEEKAEDSEELKLTAYEKLTQGFLARITGAVADYSISLPEDSTKRLLDSKSVFALGDSGIGFEVSVHNSGEYCIKNGGMRIKFSTAAHHKQPSDCSILFGLLHDLAYREGSPYKDMNFNLGNML